MLDKHLEPDDDEVNPYFWDYADEIVEEYAYEMDFIEHMSTRKHYDWSYNDKLKKLWKKYWINFPRMDQKEDDEDE